MNMCIICREEKDIFSDEHVIPDSLGGYYHIYTVCKSCNSDLGSFVDSKLVNHKFGEFQRYILGLKGKSNSLPNPFSGTHQMKEDETKKVQLRLGTDGKPAPYTVTTVSYEKIPSEGRGTKVSICLDATDEKKLDGILKKISKRLQIPLEQFDGIDRHVQSIERPSISCSFSIDLTEFKIGLLKIAYEFAVDSVPGYLEDKDAVEISRILRNADYSSVGKYVNIGTGFDHEIFSPLCEYLDMESKKHYLVLASGERGSLTCLVHLHGMFSVGVSLSKEKYPDELVVIGINDLEERTFRKVYSTDIVNEIYGPPELRFQYYFQDERSLRDFLDAQARDSFAILSAGDDIPVFDRVGKQLAAGLYGKMKEVESTVTTEALDGGGIGHNFLLQGDVFVKILPSQQLAQVLAVREERLQVAKL